MNSANKKLGIFQMVMCAMLWSIAGLLIKHVEMNPFVIAGGRSFFAARTVVVFMLITKQNGNKTQRRKTPWFSSFKIWKIHFPDYHESPDQHDDHKE